MSVDLPLPFSPIRPRISPGLTESETSSSTRMSSKVFDTPVSSSTAAVVIDVSALAPETQELRLVVVRAVPGVLVFAGDQVGVAGVEDPQTHVVVLDRVGTSEHPEDRVGAGIGPPLVLASDVELQAAGGVLELFDDA